MVVVPGLQDVVCSSLVSIFPLLSHVSIQMVPFRLSSMPWFLREVSKSLQLLLYLGLLVFGQGKFLSLLFLGLSQSRFCHCRFGFRIKDLIKESSIHISGDRYLKEMKDCWSKIYYAGALYPFSASYVRPVRNEYSLRVGLIRYLGLGTGIRSGKPGIWGPL